MCKKVLMQVYIGIDGSEKKHAAVFVNEAAAVLACITFEHTLEGLAKLETVCGDLGVDPQDVLVGVLAIFQAHRFS